MCIVDPNIDMSKVEGSHKVTPKGIDTAPSLNDNETHTEEVMHNFDINNLTLGDVEQFFQEVWHEIDVDDNGQATETNLLMRQAKLNALFPTCSSLEARSMKIAHEREKVIELGAETSAEFDRKRRVDEACFMAKLCEKTCSRLESYGMQLQSQLKNIHKEWQGEDKPIF